MHFSVIYYVNQLQKNVILFFLSFPKKTLSFMRNSFLRLCVFPRIFIYLFMFKFSPKGMFIKFRERRRKREKHICEGNINQLPPKCVHPDQGLNPQPRFVPWPGIEPATFFGVQDNVPTNWDIWPGLFQSFLTQNHFQNYIINIFYKKQPVVKN